MNQWIKNNLFVLLLLIVPFVILPFFWDKLPDEVPTHWNIKGEVDDYTPKALGVYFLPVTAIFTQALY